MKYLTAIIITAIIIAVPLSGAYSEEADMHHHEVMRDEPQELSGALQDGLRVIEVKAFRYGFDPDPIVVRINEKVRLEVRSTDVKHGIAIEEIDINHLVSPDEVSTIEFAAKNAGSYHIHCSVYCGPGHGNMHGSLEIIE